MTAHARKLIYMAILALLTTVSAAGDAEDDKAALKKLLQSDVVAGFHASASAVPMARAGYTARANYSARCR